MGVGYGGVRGRCCSVGCAERGKGVRACRLTELPPRSSRPVTQLQVTLASVQELLVQQQQKVQELAHELAAAKVRAPGPRSPQAPGAVSPLAHHVRGV